MEDIKVCAVIVTYNRKFLLKRVLSALYSQSYKVQQIIIVDNASTDGTGNYLAQNGYIANPNLTYYRCTENLGGAGGFEKGTALAYETDCDWFWLMDDDGYPSLDCLKQLLRYKSDFDFYGPLVLDDKTKEDLSFPINYAKKKLYFQSNAEIKIYIEQSAKNILDDVLIPFNGVLIKRELVSKIGFPLAKFFIWGDDIEYTYRARQHGARIATIATIYFYHPTAPHLGTKMFFNKMQFNDTDSKIKLYCLCRNNTNNLKNYKSPFHALAFIAKTYWFYAFSNPSWAKLKFAHNALWAGWWGDFDNHKSYIGENF